MRRSALGLAVALLALASACGPRAENSPPAAAPARVAPAAAARPPAVARAFVCADGFRFLVRIEGENAHVSLPGRTVVLPLMPAASGAKYDDGEVTFWRHGTTALLSADGELHRDCLTGSSRP